MTAPKPRNRDEAILLLSLTSMLSNIEDRIVAFSDGGLSTGPGPKGYGLLVAIDDGILFFIDYDKSLGATWDQITAVTFKKKLVGRLISLTTTNAGTLDFRVTSATLGQQIHDLWRANR